MPEPVVSVIVIGRNEAEHLAALATSLAPLAARCPIETLYVDSASSDTSVAVARTCFDVVAELSPDSHLNASAGRWIGTQLARGRWLLFLDGDMTLCSPFVAAVEAHVREQAGTGLVGAYRYLYQDGGEKRLNFSRDDGGTVRAFGGCVMLPREVLADGGWDPRLFANEEIELYTRLRARGIRVKGTCEPMVLHHTERIDPLVMLRSLVIRRDSVLGKKFDGIGHVLAARARAGTLVSFARWYPEPFILWGGLCAALLAGLTGQWRVALCLAVAVVGIVSWRKGPKFVLVYLSFAVQAVYGWRTFRPEWRPQLLRTWRRNAVGPSGHD